MLYQTLLALASNGYVVSMTDPSHSFLQSDLGAGLLPSKLGHTRVSASELHGLLHGIMVGVDIEPQPNQFLGQINVDPVDSVARRRIWQP